MSAWPVGLATTDDQSIASSMTTLSRSNLGDVEGIPLQRWLLEDPPVQVAVLSYGATIQSIAVPDRTGEVADVVLGFDDAAGYAAAHPYFGATVGRYANRIAQGRFRLDGQECPLPINNGRNCLHGGTAGFDRRHWDVTPVERDGSAGVRLDLTSPAGDNGFPGTLSVAVTMTLRGSHLRLDYEATADAPTVINLTNHSYFNLGGAGSCSVEEHELQVSASRYVEVTPELIPTGRLADVRGTPFEFGTAQPLGSRLRVGDEQIVRAQGYDHCLVLDSTAAEGPTSMAARVRDPGSGRVLEVWTDQPGVQLYSGNFLDATLVGKGGRVYRQSDGFCLETEHFPDAPNQPAFPSTVLRPGETFSSTTELRFTAA
jgi:aldose 1-epimerase